MATMEQQLDELLKAGDAKAVKNLFEVQQTAARELQLQFEQLLAALNAQPAPAAAVPTVPVVPAEVAESARTRLPDPVKPETFTGKLDQWPTAKIWVWLMNQYFSVWPHMSSQQKLSYAVQFLRGTAIRWWHSMQMLAVHGHIESIETWESFCHALCEQFRIEDEADQARDTLDRLKHAASVAVLNHKFIEAVMHIPPQEQVDADLKHKYISKLKPWLQYKVKVENPSTLREAMAIADRIDRIRTNVDSTGFNRDGKQNKDNRYNKKSSLPPFRSNGASTSTSTPMELGAIRSSDPLRKKLTEAEKQRLIKTNGCFYCRKENAGHISSDCPLKKKEAANFRAQ